MTNTELLESMILDKGLKKKYIAKEMGLSPYGLALKINNKNEFSASEIETLCTILGVTSLRKKNEIFFAKNVD